ncbi:carbohydrate ABC transporter permease [Brachyspira aalborgi]|uniref:Carbohydrate ABC transporter permease n=1 Tax=Brachyspira aalborgi TaxID=29522 RepID=A0A5C8E9Y9_9SPIR|nr:carbohydrate ABC transporter permease [Brachyspira aalborgi]TXJ33432.1 carbohydrate ABC transporter permease [Brachyspira aalborgi]
MKQDNTKFMKFIIVCILLIYAIISFIPFVFIILTGFKEQFEIFTNGVFALPNKFNLSNYINVLRGGIFGYFINSAIVTLISLSLILFCSSLASYVFSKLDFKFNNLFFGLIIVSMTIPVHVTLIPIYLLTQRMGLYDTIYALIGPYVAFNLPISIFILTNFMREIPNELENSAEIDGCGKIKTFFYIIFPLSKPGLVTIGIYTVTTMWNEFIFALVLTQSKINRTLPLSIWEFQGQYAANVPMIMSVLALAAAPMIILFIFSQDKLIKGMMAGAVKS